MGQKVSPVSLREFINKVTDSRWIANKKTYAKLLAEDVKIRKFVENWKLSDSSSKADDKSKVKKIMTLKKAGLAKVVIERVGAKLVVTIHSSRPGIIIGKEGADITKLREDIRKLVGTDKVVVNVSEVRKPDLNAQLVAQSIAKQIEDRVAFKRAMKKAVQNASRAGAQGIKVMCSGRLNGAEIARSEQIREGRIPLHTLRADIDYASIQAKTTYGVVGVKVWIYTGDVVNKEKLASEMARPAEYAGSSEKKRK
ncbi:MAG: 30S ribosomal protein S3 [Alphaproteobacteria bacterium]|nr:30S ribosomal protein S3 [Alphaproteobacteria bacterium]